MGHVEAFPAAPELALSGWARRRPLAWAVHDGQWGRRGLPGAPPASLVADTIAAIGPLDAEAVAQARERQEALTKPSGSLGVLEQVSVQLAGLARECPPPLPEPAVVAICRRPRGHAQGVTPWPQEVTAQMVANFLASGAVVNAIAAQAGAEVCVVDVGVAADLPDAPGLLPRKIRPGTADMTMGPAMTRDEALRAVEVGIETARDLVAAGNSCLLTGDMGIANTTASAALIAVFTGSEPEQVTGRGTGIDDPTWQRKVTVIHRALERNRPDPADPLGVLAAVGGLEHAALAGFILGGAALRVPVVLDGVIACAAALAARALAPDVLGALLAGHLSTEPGARRRWTRWVCARCSTSACASARAPARRWPCRSSSPRPACCATSRRSTAPGYRARRDELARPPPGLGPGRRDRPRQDRLRSLPGVPAAGGTGCWSWAGRARASR